MVAKTDDEVPVSSTIKMYSYLSFVFSTVPEKVQLPKACCFPEKKITSFLKLVW